MNRRTNGFLSTFAENREHRLGDEHKAFSASQGFRSRRSEGRRYPDCEIGGASFFVILSIILPIVAVLGIILAYESLLTPPSISPLKKPFEIARGESGTEIAGKLKQAGFIKSPLAFRVYTKTHGLASQVHEGVFYLSPSMDAKAIAAAITTGGSVDEKLTFIEGWRNEEYAKLIQEKMGIEPDTFLPLAKQGYMFPDTYLFNKQVTPSDMVGIMTTIFDRKVTDVMKSQIKKQNLTLDQGITLASIVERESHDSVPNERQMIASILLKRMRLGMPLQADATVQYALGYDNLQKKWWRVLSTDELRTPSSYNTYVHTGLPPGPICNPGLASIKAVAEASETPYLFYIHGKDGTAHFAKTLEEHNINIAKYR